MDLKRVCPGRREEDSMEKHDVVGRRKRQRGYNEYLKQIKLL